MNDLMNEFFPNDNQKFLVQLFLWRLNAARFGSAATISRLSIWETQRVSRVQYEVI
jgi:hypothetical protein